MELVAIFIAAVLGWQNGRFGRREWQAMALAVIGWTAVLGVASVPYFTLDGFAVSLVYHALVVVGPYTLAALARRLKDRRR